MTTTISRWRTSQQRRETASERASAASAALEAFDDHVATLPPARGVDPSALRRVVRALLPLAVEDPAFDVTVTLGASDVRVRVYQDPGVGPAVQVGVASPHPDVRPAGPAAPGPSGSHVVAELADMVRRGTVRPR